jgi:uncharacterized protein YukE
VSASPAPPGSFQPLDGRNGVPGDAGAITALARRYADTAAEIEAQANNLRRLSSQARNGWKGEAGEKFTEAAGDLAGRISKARRRYEAASRALSSFGDALVGVQTQAYSAVRKAQDAEDDVARLNANRPDRPPATATPEEALAAAAEQRAHTSAVEEARARLSTARSRYDDAKADYDRAASSAARVLRTGREDDGLADGWWDRNAGWIDTVLTVIGVVVLVLAIAALVIALFIPGLNIAVLGGLSVVTALNVTGFGLGVVMLAGHTGLAATDNGDWSDVAWDAVGVLTFGVGRLVPAATRALGATASRIGAGIAAARGGRAAFSSAGLPRLLFDLGRQVPLARSALSLSPRLGAAFRAADEAAETARAGVTALAPSPGLATRLLSLGDEDFARVASLVSQIDEAVPDTVRLTALEAIARAGAVTWGWGAQGGLLVQGGASTYGDLVAEPRDDAQAAEQIAEVTDRWSMPLLHTR